MHGKRRAKRGCVLESSSRGLASGGVVLNRGISNSEQEGGKRNKGAIEDAVCTTTASIGQKKRGRGR